MSATRGKAAEDAALDCLLQHGLKLVERNFRCRQGELDLIMTEGDQLVFVEVRSRRSARYGSAAESVTAAKRQRLLTAAGLYLARHPRWRKASCRFDVFSFDGGRSAWMRNAFGADHR